LLYYYIVYLSQFILIILIVRGTRRILSFNDRNDQNVLNIKWL